MLELLIVKVVEYKINIQKSIVFLYRREKNAKSQKLIKVVQDIDTENQALLKDIKEGFNKEMDKKSQFYDP